MTEEEMKDVYVTDHEPRVKKYATLNNSDDETYFRYKQSLKDYNSTVSFVPPPKNREKYERGSLLQALYDPFAGTKRLDNGAIFYEVQDSELDNILNSEEKLRAQYERLKQGISETIDIEESEAEELRVLLALELEKEQVLSFDEIHEALDRELSVFKEGQKYDFVKDLQDAYSDGLAKSEALKIFETIPDHAFWDIKTPRGFKFRRNSNPYNPARADPFQSFFDHREYEEYMDRRILKNNLQDGLSTYRRY